uniref:CYP405A22 n=1 Tax=Yponomeuta padella TaxID=2567738 RepID=A0A2Z5CT80_YPOPA|nr:CYP405A22 [Yponomeuta padella]
MFLSAVLVVTIVAVFVVHQLFLRSTRHWKVLTQFPGDRPLPFFGNALQVGYDVDTVSSNLMKMWKRHGMKNFRLTLGSKDWIMLSDPVDVGILLSHQTELLKPDERNAAMMPFFGNSVSTSQGERWRSTRKLMSPSFHFKTLDQKLTAVNSLGEKLLNSLSCYENKGPVDLYIYVRPFMYDLFCSTLMGVDSDLLAQLDHPYLSASRKVIKIATTNYYSYWRHIETLFRFTSDYQIMKDTIKAMHDNSNDIIKKRRAILNKLIDNIKCNNPHTDVSQIVEKKITENSYLLDELIMSKLPNGDPMPDSMINEEITLLAFTGHYTTTMTLSHTLFSMAMYPEVQRRVIEEQKSIFGDDLSRKPTTKDLGEMKYLENVIKETIRTIPTVPKISRQLQQDLTLKDGRVMPAGSSVVVYYQAIFQNPDVYPNPEVFDPDRFLKTMNTFAFVPFSSGPRNCIGFKYAWVAMKATLSSIVRRFEILEGGPGTQPQFAHRMITESDNGVQLRLKTRNYD